MQLVFRLQSRASEGIGHGDVAVKVTASVSEFGQQVVPLIVFGLVREHTEVTVDSLGSFGGRVSKCVVNLELKLLD